MPKIEIFISIYGKKTYIVSTQKRGKEVDRGISATPNSIPKYINSVKQVFKSAFEDLKEKYNVTFDELKVLLEEKPERPILLPVSIFHNTRLSALEIICKYLKENLGLKFSRIASLLNRDPRTVWITYSKSLTKQKSRLLVKDSEIRIPVEIFSDRNLSVLEILVSFLKDNYKLSFAQIALLLQKDQRNIWTVYSRFKKKKHE